MAVLRNVYNLAFNTLIQAKVQAHNEFGFGIISEANTDPTGAKIQTVPVAVNNLNRGSLTSET